MFSKDTVRLVVQFRDFKGNSIVPEDIKLIIYDSKQEILEEIGTGIIYNYEDDSHYYDFIAPEHDFIYEFSGSYKNKPILARQKITVNFTN